MSEEEQAHNEFSDAQQELEGNKINKEVLIRCSDMSPEDECGIVGIANFAIEEIGDLTGIYETQKFSKICKNIKQ